MSGPRRFRSTFLALAIALAAVAGCDPGPVTSGDTRDPAPEQTAVETGARPVSGSGQPASCLDGCFRRQAACERKTPDEPVGPAGSPRAQCAIEWSECLAACLNGAATRSLPAISR